MYNTQSVSSQSVAEITNIRAVSKHSVTDPTETRNVICVPKITYAAQEATDHIVLIWPESLRVLTDELQTVLQPGR